ncbi:RNA polymerase subunit sigma-24 [Phenylobacterium hankyongense]|uniref:RNA polymerase subunit sigma-24 n=1 Tax=Phenylobacterium hankyongense TaxID=1813876 RepID=A0A328B2P8_9CAUL|nr:RNA polymerase sigma factor [Phenylobacterium hankyongense]RAK60196.1 RNA polymerase subunit sigma-24 [Phenylobacterium hankyongense]
MSQAPERGDAELAQAAAGGDERAHAELVRRHKEGLYRLLRPYLGDPDEAFEAAHEAFIAAWGALARYDPSRSFGAWLRTIAINKARDRGRRLAVRRFVLGATSLEGGGAHEREDTTARADDALIERERIEALERAIARLPASLRAALLLTAIEGRSQQEAGEILGVSAKSIAPARMGSPDARLFLERRSLNHFRRREH